VVYDFTQNPDPILVIWDAGGTDTLDCSGYSTNQVINLTAGSYSNVGYMTNNVAVAFNCTIEGAAGGSGADTITGNSANNTINGNGGTDTIYGGAGNDIMSGGGGTDTVVFTGISTNYLVTFNSATNTYTLVDQRSGSPDGTDQVTGFEIYRFANGDFTSLTVSQSGSTVYGTPGDDELSGTSGNDTIFSGDGSDRIVGGAGADQIDGQDGFDYASYLPASAWVTASLVNPAVNSGDAAGDTYTSIEGLIGSAFSDTLFGDANGNHLLGLDGNDTLDGGGGSDVLDGGNGDDWLIGGSGNDQLYAGAGLSNTLIGGSGADAHFGGAGWDTVSYHLSTDSVRVNLGNLSENVRDAAGDTYFDFENLFGSRFNDALIGDSGANRLVGYQGADTLTGNGGSDVFIFLDDPQITALNVDNITDFQDGIDRVDLSLVTGLDSFSQLSISENSSFTRVAFGNYVVINLIGVRAAQIDVSDFNL
jgi:serralysin